MIAKRLKQAWCEFEKGHPGHRFQDRYERKQRARTGKATARRFLQPLAGMILVVVGLVFCVIPGPGVPLVFAGAMVLAGRSRTIARVLDWLEVKVRDLVGRGAAWWRRASGVARNAMIVLAVSAIAGAGYGAYRVFFDR